VRFKAARKRLANGEAAGSNQDDPQASAHESAHS
jgi:hypothetical protein